MKSKSILCLLTIAVILQLGLLAGSAQTPFVLSTNYPLPPYDNGSLSVVAFTNADGLVDLVYSGGNMTNGSLTLLTNNGGGIFTSNQSYTVGKGPVAVIAADVNGDGKMDLICANQSSNTLSVLTNNGSGGFVSASTLNVGDDSFPTSVAAFKNVDGKVDLACANASGGTISIFTNIGSGNFIFATNLSVGATPHSITAADVNNDGAMDLICANEDSSTLSVLTNNGSGGFALATNIPVGFKPVFVVAADVNKDGWVDLISANFGSNTLSVVTNNQSGGFALAGTIPVGSQPYSVCAADVNGDGWPDLISANGGVSSLTVLINNDSGGFALATDIPLSSGSGWVVAADVNGDGKLDLINTIAAPSAISVFFNTGFFLFPPTITTQPTNTFAMIGYTANLNVVISGTTPFSYQWLFNGTNLMDNGNFSGSGTSNLTLIAASTDDVGNYSVIITNSYGSVTSTVVSVMVGFAPTITTQPTNTSVVIGNTTNLSVAVSGTGPFSYQWFFNGMPLDGIINTIAGGGSGGGSDGLGDGGAATNASFSDPIGVAVDASGDVFIADEYDSVIRKVDTNGIITIVAGNGSSNGNGDNYFGDGGAATNAGLNFPTDVTVDSQGNLFISDGNNCCVRKVDTNGIITTVAGNGSGGFSGDGGAATNARLRPPGEVAVDSRGNLFIADEGDSVIREVDTNDIITTVAGKGYSYGYSGDGGAATNAGLNQPFGVAVDAYGNLFIADSENCVIRKVDTNGIITTIAGKSYSGGYSGDGGTATNASLNFPGGVALDAYGNLFIADVGNSVIRKVDINGIITTVAGNGSYNDYGNNYFGDGGAPTNAGLNFPSSVALDASGDLFIADQGNNVIREVKPPPGTPTLALNNVGGTNAGNYSVIISSPYGSVTSALAIVTVLLPPTVITQPANTSVAIGNTTNLSVSVSGTPPFTYQWLFNGTNVTDNSSFSSSTTSNLTIFATATSVSGNYLAIISNPYGSVTSAVATVTAGFAPGIAIPPANTSVVIGNTTNLSTTASGIGPFTYQWFFNGMPLDGIITTIAGDSSGGDSDDGYSGDGGAATNASLNYPFGVALDASGDVFIADEGDSVIREVDTNDIITTVAGNGSFNYYGQNYFGDGGAATNAGLNDPAGVVLDAHGNLFIADTYNNVIRKVDIYGIITTVAGGNPNYPNGGYFGDGGAATNASLNYPFGVALDASGDVFIADEGDSVIRKVDINGIITTVAGNGSLGYSGDGGAATNAGLNNPFGVAVDAYGNLFIADSYNNAIREVNTNGIITTVAGNGFNSYSGDGGVATNAGLSIPEGVAIDASGNLFIADFENDVIRKVETNGIITTVAGKYGDPGYAGDGGSPINAIFGFPGPGGLAFNASGNLLIADPGNCLIREIKPLGAPALTLNNVGGANAGNYSVIISSSFGSVTSSIVTLTVTGPSLGQVGTSNGNFDFSWSAISTRVYQVQYTTNLTQPSWVNLGNPVTATNGVITASDVMGANSQRYYRLTAQ